MKLLLVEDEADIAAFVRQGLSEEGFDVTWLPDGEQAMEWLSSNHADILLLDIRLPGMDGVETCRRIRETRVELPIIMLTALDAVEDRVRGLRAGADDYIPKPFAFEELVARIEALLRRVGHQTDGQRLTDGPLVLEPDAHRCTCHGRPVELTVKEFALLSYFLANRGRALSRDEIHRDVWGYDFDRGTNLIDVYVAYVRSKLSEVDCPAHIETVRGIGYRYHETPPDIP